MSESTSTTQHHPHQHLHQLLLQQKQQCVTPEGEQKEPLLKLPSNIYIYHSSRQSLLEIDHSNCTYHRMITSTTSRPVVNSTSGIPNRHVHGLWPVVLLGARGLVHPVMNEVEKVISIE